MDSSSSPGSENSQDNYQDHDANAHDDNGVDSTPPPEHLPQFLSFGRQFSLAALREQIENEFVAETAARPDLLSGSDESARREMVREVLDYVLSTQSITLARSERLAVLDLIYQDLFNFGPLAAYLKDPDVSEFTVDGPDNVYVRYGAQEMTRIETGFDDAGHLERTVQRVMSLVGAQISRDEPVLEVGVTVANRPARLTVFAPPISPLLHVDARLHSPEPATLGSCVASGLLAPPAVDLLRVILAAGHGLMIVGDVGTGKTTLLQALIPLLPHANPTDTLIAERVAELRPPPGVECRIVTPPGSERPPASFAEVIESAVDAKPGWLVLDEVRFDEAKAVWRALTDGSSSRCLWTFRGATDPVRLRAAFSMSVRRAVPGIEQTFIHSALLDRLPFVATMQRKDQRLSLLSIGEWQADQPGQLENVNLRTIWPDGAQPLHKLA